MKDDNLVDLVIGEVFMNPFNGVSPKEFDMCTTILHYYTSFVILP